MKNIFYLLFAMLVLSGCKKDQHDPEKQSVDVYISGTSVADVDALEKIASYWKNGVLTTVNDPAHNSEGLGIAVKDNDVYVVGSVFDPVKKRMVAAYWKNGAVNLLPDNGHHSAATSIVIVNSDIYIGGSSWDGFEDDITSANVTAVYWKNGVQQTMGPFYNIGIKVQGSDIYSAGTTRPDNGRRPILWKNGIISELNTNGQNFEASDIDVVGNDVYLSGGVIKSNQHVVAAYWKNGAITEIPLEGTYCVANQISVVKSEVYLTVSSRSANPNPIYYLWKNGNLTKVTEKLATTGIAVSGQDVYISEGVNSVMWPAAAYWVNGLEKPLEGAFITTETGEGKPAYTTDIVLVKH